MNDDEKNKLFTRAIQGPDTLEGSFDLVFKAAQKDGRESVLKAAMELAATGNDWLAERIAAAGQAQQATNTLKALGDWCDLEPEVNYYLTEKTKRMDPFKRWHTVLHHKKDPETDMSRTLIYGSTHADCMAKAAQFCLLEIERWSR